MINESLLIDYVVQQAVNIYFGEMFIFGLVLLFILIATMTYNGLPFGSSVVISLPILFLMIGLGIFGMYGWIGSGVLVVVGIVYAVIITRMMSN